MERITNEVYKAGNEVCKMEGNNTDNNAIYENEIKRICGNVRMPNIEAEELPNRIGQTIQIHGSIYKIRKMSDFAFVLLRTKRAVVQCIYSQEFSNFSLEELAEESCVVVTAYVVAEERSKAGYELRMTEVEIVSAPQESSPIVINQKRVDTSLENLLNFRPITLRNEKERAIFKLQEGICRGFPWLGPCGA